MTGHYCIEVVKTGKEYERTQKEMDEKLGKWEGLQVS